MWHLSKCELYLNAMGTFQFDISCLEKLCRMYLQNDRHLSEVLWSSYWGKNPFLLPTFYNFACSLGRLHHRRSPTHGLDTMKSLSVIVAGLMICAVQFLHIPFSLQQQQQYEQNQAPDGGGGMSNTTTRSQESTETAALQHHVIIVPYRNRQDHLDVFLQRMSQYLPRNFPNDKFSLYIIEQADNGPFSRGFLLNVGLSLLRKNIPQTHCVIFHDVDLIPKNDGVPYNDCTFPIRLGNELQQFNYSIPYDKCVGGVFGMHLHDWVQINGMSNDYEGWGGEDDDFYERMARNKLLRGGRYGNSIVVPPPGNGTFDNIDQTTSRPFEVKINHSDYALNVDMLGGMRRMSNRWKHDGLNDVGYKIVEMKSLEANVTADSGGGLVEARLFSIESQPPAHDKKPRLGQSNI